MVVGANGDICSTWNSEFSNWRYFMEFLHSTFFIARFYNELHEINFTAYLTRKCFSFLMHYAFIKALLKVLTKAHSACLPVTASIHRLLHEWCLKNSSNTKFHFQTFVHFQASSWISFAKSLIKYAIYTFRMYFKILFSSKFLVFMLKN